MIVGMGASPVPSFLRPGLSVPATLALLLGSTTAMGRAAPPAQAPAFPTRTELVLVDALVFDAHGNPVPGLTADDFVLREDGVAQSIQRFETATLPESAPAPPATTFVSTNARPQGEHRPAPRTFVIVFDDAQLSPATGKRAREAIATFLEKGLRDDDLVTIVSTATGTWWSARLGEGRKDLLAVLHGLEGRRQVDHSGSYISDYEAMRLYLNRDEQIGALVVRRFYDNGVILDPPNQEAAQAAQELQLGEGHPLVRAKAAEAYAQEKARNEASLRTLVRIGDALAGGEGRKSVLLVSDGFVYDSTLPGFQSVVRAMSRANAAVYFLDARGLPGTAEHASAEVGRATQETDVLSFMAQTERETEGSESVAADTGGFSFRNPNNLAGGMEKIEQEQRSYYLIGYSSTNTRRDGKFRSIQLEVKRPGLTVRARKGYYAPSAEEPAPPEPGETDPRVREALDSPYQVGGIPIRMASYVLGPAGSDRAGVLIVAEADPQALGPEEPGKKVQATLDSYLLVAARDGGLRVPVEKKMSLEMSPEVRARLRRTWVPIFRDLQLPAGTYQARFVLRDEGSGRLGTVRHDFEVPPLEKFRVSTPVLTDSLEGDAKTRTARPVPLARRSFPSGENLAYIFDVYGAHPDPATGRPRVTSRCEVRRADGKTLVEGSPRLISPGPQGQLGEQVPISLQGAPAGDYEIVLTLDDEISGARLEETDPFTVLPSSPPPPSGQS
jgi:VWFA-related protein